MDTDFFADTTQYKTISEVAREKGVPRQTVHQFLMTTPEYRAACLSRGGALFIPAWIVDRFSPSETRQKGGKKSWVSRRNSPKLLKNKKKKNSRKSIKNT